MPHSDRTLPPLDLLLGFEAAARHLSFTLAASELFLTQSAISRQIQALEEHLGCALFERRHKSLALTEAGQSYFRAVSPLLDGLRDATRRARETRKGHVLTVTTTIAFASMWLVPRLVRFRREFPGVDVRVAATGDSLDLERDGIDVAIRDSPVESVPANSIHLVSEHLAPVCSPAYLKETRAAGKPLAKPADLRHHVLLHTYDPTGRWPWISWSRWAEANGIAELSSASSLILNQYDHAIAAAQHGQGIALGRMTLVSEMVRNKQLLVLFGKRQRLARVFCAIYSKAAQSSQEAKNFVAWVQREISADEAGLPG